MVTLGESVDINGWAVLISALAGFGLGAIWYSPLLFAKQWQEMTVASTHLKADDMKKMSTAAMFGSALVYLVMAYVLAYLNSLLGVTSATEGLVVASWIALGFVLTLDMMRALYNQTRKKLFAINTGYVVLSLLLMGLILGAWN